MKKALVLAVSLLGLIAGGAALATDVLCQDNPPDSSFTCEQQASWGKCGETWMQGFCDYSCGRCHAHTSTYTGAGFSGHGP